MARIRYIALLAKDPEDLSDFYQRFLRMKEISRSADGDISLTDTFMNLTLLHLREGLEERPEVGLHHLGFEVENIEEVEKRFKELYPSSRVSRESGSPHYGELRIHDPDGIPVSLSEQGFGVLGEGRSFPRIRHVAFATPDPTRTLEFYSGLFGLEELPTSFDYRREGKPNRFAGDGNVNFAMHPDPAGPGQDPRPGFNHIGFLVSDMEGVVRELTEVVQIVARPPDRPFAELRFKDPEGNAIDLSQEKGWEVATGKWERGLRR